MRYIGIIASGNEEVAVEVLREGTVSRERLIPGLGDRLLTGTISNPSKIRPLLINFYSQNRESQSIRLEPLQQVVIENQPCDRLLLSRVGSEPLAFYSYFLRIHSAESDQELMVFMSDSVLRIEAVSEASIQYIQESRVIILANVDTSFKAQLLLGDLLQETIIDEVLINGISAGYVSTSIDVFTPVQWQLIQETVPTFVLTQNYGSVITSANEPNREFDRECVIEESGTNLTHIVLQMDRSEDAEAYDPMRINYRKRTLKAIDSIVR